MSFYDNQGNEIIKVTLKNTKGSKTAPLTTTEQVLAHDIFNSENPAKSLDSVLNDIYNAASSAMCEACSAYSHAYSAESSASYAYDQANSAYSLASEAYYEANSAIERANDAYDEANNAYAQANSAYSKVSDHINDNSIHWYSYDIYNIAVEASSSAYDQANNAYDAANLALNLLNISHNTPGSGGGVSMAGTYTLKATVSESGSVTIS